MVHGIVAACVADKAEQRADHEGQGKAHPAKAGRKAEL